MKSAGHLAISSSPLREHRERASLHGQYVNRHPSRRQPRLLRAGRGDIRLPPFETFKDKESYYATALHELTDWTKHERRLERDFSANWLGDRGYAREELVAELGSAFFCADLGITPEIRNDHAAYLGYWLDVLKEDKRAIFSAAAHAPRTSCKTCSRSVRRRPKSQRRDAARDDAIAP